MGSKSFLTKTLSAVVKATDPKLTTDLPMFPFLRCKEFSAAAYDSLLDFEEAEQKFKDKDGNTVLREHLVPLLNGYGFHKNLVPCLIFKEFSLALDERIVVNEENVKSSWKVRDFLGRRDTIVPSTVHFPGQAFSILEYQVVPEHTMSKDQARVSQYAEVFSKAYLLLRMYDLDLVVGLRLVDDASKDFQKT